MRREGRRSSFLNFFFQQEEDEGRGRSKDEEDEGVPSPIHKQAIVGFLRFFSYECLGRRVGRLGEPHPNTCFNLNHTLLSPFLKKQYVLICDDDDDIYTLLFVYLL